MYVSDKINITASWSPMKQGVKINESNIFS